MTGWSRNTVALAVHLLGLAAGGVHAAGEPVWQALPGAPTSTRIDDVWFIDERTGWSCADGVVYRTRDGGVTWRGNAVPGISMRSIAFASPSHGWIGSLNAATPLWATVDSGQTWRTVPLPDPRPAGICGLWSVNDHTVYGCGRYNFLPTVIKTTDAGVTWTSVDLSAVASGLVDCWFFEPDSGFVVGRANTAPPVTRVLFTGDGGKTWSIRHTGVRDDSWCWKLSFPSRRTGYVSVETLENPGLHCLKTLDGGETWAEVAAPILTMQGIGFATPALGWSAGRGTNVKRTSDGGATWQDDRFGSNINRIRFLRPDLAYASGRTIYKYSIPSPVVPATWTSVKQVFRR